MKATAITWAQGEIARAQDVLRRRGHAPNGNRDPNFLHTREVKNNMWHLALKRVLAKIRYLIWQSRRTHGQLQRSSTIVHFDLHGQGNPIPNSKNLWEIHVGMDAMKKKCPDAASQMRRVLTNNIRAAVLNFQHSIPGLWKKRIVSTPWVARFRGDWDDQSRHTVSRQMTKLGTHLSAQIEMSLKIRQALVREPQFMAAFLAAFYNSYKSIKDQRLICRDERRR